MQAPGPDGRKARARNGELRDIQARWIGPALIARDAVLDTGTNMRATSGNRHQEFAKKKPSHRQGKTAFAFSRRDDPSPGTRGTAPPSDALTGRKVSNALDAGAMPA